MTATVAKKAKPATSPSNKTRRFSMERLSEPSTWGGILAVAAAIITGGASVLADPILLGQIAAGLGMVFSKEG